MPTLLPATLLSDSSYEFARAIYCYAFEGASTISCLTLALVGASSSSSGLIRREALFSRLGHYIDTFTRARSMKSVSRVLRRTLLLIPLTVQSGILIRTAVAQSRKVDDTFLIDARVNGFPAVPPCYRFLRDRCTKCQNPYGTSSRSPGALTCSMVRF